MKCYYHRSTQQFSTYYYSICNPGLKLDLSRAPGLMGWATTRGDRKTNEDRVSFGYLNSIQDFDCEGSVKPFCFAVVDGHGGSFAADYVAAHLAENIEASSNKEIPLLAERWRRSSVYLKRLNLKIFSKHHNYALNRRSGYFDMSRRLSMAFLKTDLDIIDKRESQDSSGAVATAIVIYGKERNLPFWESLQYRIEIAHLGDTRCIVGERLTNQPLRLTREHHVDSESEILRLRDNSNLVNMDSFGEFRFGSLANTRAFGEATYLRSAGIISEPEITSIDAFNQDYTFLALVSDGVTIVMEDQEILDIVHNSKTPAQAAKEIVDYCRDLRSEDNATCLIIRLGGWSLRSKSDSSFDLRKLKLASVSNMRKQ